MQQDATTDEAAPESEEPVDATRNTRIADVIADPVLGEWGRLLFPVDRGYVYGSTLGDLQLTWYMALNPQATVDVVNDVRFTCPHSGMGTRARWWTHRFR